MKKTAVPAIALLFLSLNAAAQYRIPVTVRGDLNSTLADLERVAQTTHSDISNVRIDKWGVWRPGFLGKDSNTKEAQHLALSLKRNLVSVLPGMISDVRSSRGSLSTTFKLYDDVSVLCQTLDSLVTAAERHGKKNEFGPLADDFSAISRIRRNLAGYVEQKASSMEGHSRVPVYASSHVPSAGPQHAYAPSQPSSALTASAVPTSTGTLPKKIIIDDTIPDKKTVKKKSTANYSNLE